ncbi:MAG: hypothetical protein IJ081_02150 [Prevotella sp.]|jgi:hypothetical protein|nr:hypothetical protein [Prevotella sp.]
MKNSFYLLMMMLTFVLMPMQAQPKQQLIINGETVDKVVAKITFEGDNVVLHFSDQTTQTADMSTVTLSFIGAADIRSLSTYQMRSIVDGMLTLEGLAPGTEVQILDAAGKQLIRTRQHNVNVAQLRPGIYVMKAGKQIVKFVKR